MPNPFPGMNPFLERPTLWDSFHNAFIIEINRALVAQLPSGFATKADARCYITQGEERIRTIKPDDIITNGANSPRTTLMRRGAFAGIPTMQSAGVLTMTPPTGIAVREAVEARELYLEVIDMDNDERVITVIEVLSPSNKARGNKGRTEYRRKQTALLNSDANLLEVDLLRAGLHTVAAPQEDMQAAGTWDYTVCLHLARTRHQYPFWLCALRAPLPVVAVPLTFDHPDLALDLQTVLNDCFDANGFDRNVRYDRDPVPPLKPDDALWADNLLREKALR